MPDNDNEPPRRSDDALRTLLDADGTAIVIAGFDGITRVANDAALRLLGVDDIDELQRDNAGHGLLRSMLDQAPRLLVTGGYDGTVRLWAVEGR